MTRAKIYCVWYSDYEWICECGKHNEELEGQIDLETGDSLRCSSCQNKYTFDKESLTLKEDLEC